MERGQVFSSPDKKVNLGKQAFIDLLGSYGVLCEVHEQSTRSQGDVTKASESGSGGREAGGNVQSRRVTLCSQGYEVKRLAWFDSQTCHKP